MKIKMMIVDDEIELGAIVHQYFEECGAEIVRFQNPIQAIQYFKQNKNSVDFVITDYNMPSLTGLEMMRVIHASRMVPYVLLSGNLGNIEDDYSLKQIKRVGKPFGVEAMQELVNLVGVKLAS